MNLAEALISVSESTDRKFTLVADELTRIDNNIDTLFGVKDNLYEHIGSIYQIELIQFALIVGIIVYLYSVHRKLGHLEDRRPR